MMDNYQKIMLEKGQEKLEYIQISNYYKNIIYTIYETLEKESAAPEIYSDEYLEAYGFLQKAEWGLNDITQLKEYIDEADFKYFAIENLTNARNRIEEYLKTTPSITVTDYKKYDVILKLKEELQDEPVYTESCKKYKRISYQDSEIKHIQVYIDNIKNYTKLLKKELTSDRLEYIETENLLETIKLLEKIEKDLEIKEKKIC